MKITITGTVEEMFVDSHEYNGTKYEKLILAIYVGKNDNGFDERYAIEFRDVTKCNELDNGMTVTVDAFVETIKSKAGKYFTVIKGFKSPTIIAVPDKAAEVEEMAKAVEPKDGFEDVPF